MNKNRIKTSLIAAAVALASLSPLGAIAQPGGDHRGNDRSQRDQRDDRRDDKRGDDRHDDRRDNRADNRGNSNRGAGPEHSFYAGKRLPPAYHQRRYVVEDWRGHQLRQPPRGYHWVQSGTDYLLVAVATGLIAQVLLNN